VSFEALAWGVPGPMVRKLVPENWRVRSLPDSENCVIVRHWFQVTSSVWQTDGRTDTPPVPKSLYNIAELDKKMQNI